MSRSGLLRVLARRVLGGGVAASVAHIARHPDRLLVHGRRLLRGETAGLSNRYGASDRSADVQWVCKVANVPPSKAEEAFDELDADEAFYGDLHSRYTNARPDWASTFEFGRFRSIYALVRILAPETLIETGVHDGLSSSVILRALARNGHGRLVSIDRPSSDLPVSTSGPGWLVPEALRDRWILEIGDAVRLLPDIAAKLAPVDLFLHDSDHSLSHRRFEFTTVKPSMATTGIILSDDDEPADGLLRGLAESWGMDYVPPPDGVLGVGAVTPETAPAA